MYNRIKVFAVFVFLIPFGCLSQDISRTDSLKEQLHLNISDSGRSIICLEIAREFLYNKPDSTIYYAKKASQFSELGVNNSIALDAIHLIGSAYLLSGNIQLAKSTELKAIKMALLQQNKRKLGDAHNVLGLAYEAISINDSALYHYDMSMKIGEEIDDTAMISNALSNSAVLSHKLGNDNQAIAYYKRAIELDSSSGSEKNIAASLIGLGNAYTGESMYPQAHQTYQNAIVLAKKYDNLYQLSSAYNDLGTLYFTLKSPNKALEYYLKSLEAKKASHSGNRRLANSIFNMANLMLEIQQPERSLEYCRESLRLFSQSQNFEGVIMSNNLLSSIFLELDILDSVLLHLNIVDSLLHKYQVSPEKNANHYENKGRYWLEVKNQDTALSYFERALELHLNNTTEFTVIKKIASLAEVYMTLQLFNRSYNLYRLAIDRMDTLVSYSDWETISRLHVSGGQAAYHIGMIEEAYQHQLLAREAIEHQLTEDHFKTVMLLEIKFRSKQQKQEIALQNTQLQAQQAQIKTRNWMLGGIGISSLLLLLIGYTQYKRRQEKTEAEKEMAVMRGKWEAMETLRGKISKDLHDGVGYNMRLVASQVESLPEQSDMTKTLLQDIRNTDDKIRSIAYELSPGELKNVTLNKAIELHVEKIQASSDITFHLDIFPDDALDSVSPEMATALYRILQECSSNALKHSQATQIEIQLSLFKDGVNFMYEDNGIGFDSENVEEGSGLLNMKTRCMDIGATFHIDAKSGRGTVINIDFPLSLTSK